MPSHMQSYKGLHGFSMISGDALDRRDESKDSEESSTNIEPHFSTTVPITQNLEGFYC